MILVEKKLDEIFEPLLNEKVTRLVCTEDKREIVLGTSFGRVFILSVEDLKVMNSSEAKKIRQDENFAVTDIAVKKDVIAVSHENG